jgi:hypothetical protein
MTICRFHWSGFSGAQVIRFLRFTGQLQLCGCIVQYLSQCSSVVFFPDPVADVCRFKGLGLCAQQRQVCLCQSYAFASFAHSPSVLLLVAVVCTVTDVLGRDPSSAVCSTSSCYYGFVAVLRVSMHIVGIVHTHLLSGPAADMRCGPQPKGSPQQRQVY